ncbi:hypothetical protein VNO80_23871 [Phaseolus coccineus]|uniref:AAA+ ATPase domain-containing protein n=1 Tax=Phaseolus coccineus TaxID=3886 RepID=A0AAN9M682_PHACN
MPRDKRKRLVERLTSGCKMLQGCRQCESVVERGKNKKNMVLWSLSKLDLAISGTLHILSEKCMNFESRQSAYEQLLEAVKNNDVSMIGLYGMGGCGKTTLAMEVMKLVEAEHCFEKVLFVPISSTVEVRRIQEKIASSLQYTFQETEVMERAQRLCLRLKQEKKILVILDDVWEKLDFGAIGIPSYEHHKGCKILITTRLEQVCTSMDCQRRIYLPILKDEEAWTLFQKKALISEGTPDTLKHLGRLISNECKGLPVAIATVASSLKGKVETIWSVALNRLRSSKPINIERGLTNPYKCLQLSYDNLDTEEAKSLFLLCSVFPEDLEIPIEVLTRFAIGLGVVGEAHSYKEARSEVIAAKIKLVSSCLLLDEEDECVKMHDIVRDVAHLIAKDENKIIKCEEEKDVTIEQNSVKYLWCLKFPNDLDCSHLEFLFLRKKLEEFDGIFKRMRMLKVLILASDKDGITPLSTVSLKPLTTIRDLVISNYQLSDFTFVSDMKKLQSLSLFGCSLPSFSELQTGVGITQVPTLKLLELNKCDIKGKKFEVIKRTPLLEELYIVDIEGEWDANSEDNIEFFNTFSIPQTLQRDIFLSEDGDKKEELDENIEEDKHPHLYSTSNPSTTAVNNSPGNYDVKCPSLGKLSLAIGRCVDFFSINCSSDASKARQEDYIAIKISNSDYVPPLEIEVEGNFCLNGDGMIEQQYPSFTARATGVSNPIRSPSFRLSVSLSAQQSAFAVGVLSDLYAFHRSTENSLCPYHFTNTSLDDQDVYDFMRSLEEDYVSSEYTSSQELVNMGNESIEEEPSTEGDKTKPLSTGVEDVGIGGGVATHIESGGMDTLAQHSKALVDKQRISEPCLMNQQKQLGEIVSSSEIPQKLNVSFSIFPLFPLPN